MDRDYADHIGSKNEMEIDGRRIVATGSCVLTHGQSLSFRPIPSDQGFALAVDLRFENDRTPAEIRVVSSDGPGSAILKITGGYSDGLHVANNDPLKFASGLKKTYYGNFCVVCRGAYDAFTSVFTYSILEAEKS